MKRLHYLDNIRILLTFLVIIHHTAIGYGAMGGWFYVSPEKVGDSAKLVLSAMLAVNQAFFYEPFLLYISLFCAGLVRQKRSFEIFY
ncbi:MAG: hypothetical protein HC905_02190 [Bacteroidales bacterium]|nr:hypothetical protein [Bacteroidales bacterium]